MADFYQRAAEQVVLLGDREHGWRRPQLGALGATMAHWSLADRKPTVISIPTGTGKTAVGMAAPFLTMDPPTRVLVLAPARQIRRQLVEHFSTYAQLQRLGVLPEAAGAPSVFEMSGKTDDWSALETYDVVVALPNSISPVHYDDDLQPPHDLFDLVVVDEAHHAPAETWRAVLDHFAQARALLLTATPRRRDGKRIPGSLEYYYPLRRALDEGLYKPIQPVLLPASDPSERAQSDVAIAGRAAALLASDEHGTSVLLVRGGTIARPGPGTAGSWEFRDFRPVIPGTSGPWSVAGLAVFAILERGVVAMGMPSMPRSARYSADCRESPSRRGVSRFTPRPLSPRAAGTTDSISVLVVDHHRMFGEALGSVIGAEPDLAFFGTVGSAKEAIERCREGCPDVVLMALALPGIDGIQATALLKERCPETQVVIVTGFGRRDRIARAIQAGAIGFVAKTQPTRELLSAIRLAAAGEMVLPTGELYAVVGSLHEDARRRSETESLLGLLSKRERDVLASLARGNSTTEVARELFISTQTVQSHVKNVLTKLGVRTKLAAVVFAIRYRGFEEPDEKPAEPAQEPLWVDP